MKKSNDEKVLVVDFGSQTTQLIVRRVREAGYRCEMIDCNKLPKNFKNKPLALILSGGPASSFKKKSPKIDIKMLNMNIPILGICYGMQLISQTLGGQVKNTKKREFGKAQIKLIGNNLLFKDVKKTQNSCQVWMSHGDEVTKIPKGFNKLATTKENNIAAIGNIKKKIFGLQFHPEVAHTIEGKLIIKNFLKAICQLKENWKIENFLEKQINKIKNEVKEEKIICGLSGGVDSSVVAALLSKAIGKNLICIFVNHGFLRKNEEKEVISNFKKHMNSQLIYVNAKSIFFNKIKDVIDPEKKRKIIGKEFIKIFEKEAKKIKNIKYLAQGTLYPDVIESKKINGANFKAIKSHHNVGGLPKRLNLKLIEPLRELFKDEVRELGKELGLPKSVIERHPFPGPGLAIRLPGKITIKKINILKQADKIYIEELKKNKLYNKIWQAFCVLLPVKSVGVMGDSRSYEYTISVRAITSSDGMTADIYYFKENFLKNLSGRIIGEVKGINRVLYDITSKPPATIEWE